MNAFELEMPSSLRAAIGLLDPEDPSVRVISGGTALMLMMRADVFQPSRLISLRGIEEEFSTLKTLPDGSFRIGAMATLAEIEHAQELSRMAPVIRQTMRTLSNVRVRNVATLGGALAHGDPHMDMPPVLVALGAHVVATGPEGGRRIPVEELHTGYYETVLAGNELISEIIIPPQDQRRATYLKCTTRSAHDWPALGVAVSIDLAGEVVRDPRIVISAVSERPLRVPEAEAVITDQPLGPDIIRKAGIVASDTIETVSDVRGSAAYKKELVRVYVERALRAVAVERAEVFQ